jgi:GTP cyclohydrolase IIa
MIRLGIIQLKDYESWIKSLGFDREWIIQATQADIYKHIVTKCAELELFGFPLTYDSYLVIINSMELFKFEKLLKAIELTTPVPINAYLGIGTTYLEALNNIKPFSNIAKEYAHDLNALDAEPIVAAHIDMDGYLQMLHEKGLSNIISFMNELIYNIKKYCMRFGGIAYYAGGDNILCFIPYNTLNEFKTNFNFEKMKIGIGVSKKPRGALKLATQALELIRDKKCGNICILEE